MADGLECCRDILNMGLSGWALAIMVVDFMSSNDLSQLSNI